MLTTHAHHYSCENFRHACMEAKVLHSVLCRNHCVKLITAGTKWCKKATRQIEDNSCNDPVTTKASIERCFSSKAIASLVDDQTKHQ